MINEKIVLIVQMFGHAYRTSDNRLTFTNDGVPKVCVLDGFSYRAVYDGSWHVSGPARKLIMDEVDGHHALALSKLEEERTEAAKAHAILVENNNKLVLSVFADPQPGIYLQD